MTIDAVDRVLALWRQTPFVYGQTDCMLSIGDYIAANGGEDVTGLFRGLYSTEVEALAHMARFGGPSGLIDLTGIDRVDEAERGDVVILDTGEHAIGAICTGRGIAARLERGVVEINRSLVRTNGAWHVGKGR